MISWPLSTDEWKAVYDTGLYPYFLKHRITGTAEVKYVSYTEEQSIQSHHTTK